MFVKNDSGEVERNFWTGYGHIKTNVSDSTTVYINPSDICRKVIVFHSDGTDVVIDFMRKKSRLHYDIVVPLHLLKDDMVLIQGSELADKWIGRIDKVDMATKTVKVYFYMKQVIQYLFAKSLEILRKILCYGGQSCLFVMAFG